MEMEMAFSVCVCPFYELLVLPLFDKNVTHVCARGKEI